MAAYLRKYGTGTGADIYITIPKAGSANHAVGADWTPAAGDVKVSKDGGAAANIGTLPTAIAMGNSAIWKFVFTDAELEAKEILVTVSDSATKAVDDTAFAINTFGHASALYAFDFSAATVTLHPDYDAAKTAASQASVDVIDGIVDTIVARVVGTIASGTHQPQSGDAYARLGAPAGASVSADVAAVKAETALIVDDTGTTIPGSLLLIDDAVDDLEGRLTAALATTLQAHHLAVGRVVVDAGSTTTAVVFKTVNGAAASAVDDHYNGRVLVFTSGTLALQATSITDYNGTTKTATVVDLTSGPAEDVTAVIV
jgi:hypothetical protein